MPLSSTSDNAPTTFPKPNYLTLGNFKRGVITLVNPANLPKNALAAGQNIFLVEDGQPSIRPGVDWFGTIPALPTPAAATAVKATGSTLGIGVYKYEITFVNAQGETSAGASVSVTTSSGSTNVNLSAIPLGPGGTTARKIYRTIVGGSTYKFLHTLANNTATTFSDSTADGSLGSTVPAVNTAIISSIDGFDYFDDGGDVHLVVCGDGNIFRSTNDGLNWTLCTGFTMTAGATVKMEQYNSFLYIVNGVDIIVRYDGSTTLQTYTVLTTPAAATAAITGLTGTTYTYFYKLSAVSEVGFSAAGASVSVSVGQPRTNWDATSNFVTLTTPSPQSTQTRFDIYISVDDLNYYYLDSIISSSANPQVTYKDDGSAIQIPSTIAPTTNTTQGPTVQELVTVGLRLYGVRDPNNPYRIWFTSGASPLGAFSDGYDGGYLDWQLGGKYFPVKVADYRDGKGDSIATVWLNSADAQGGIIQMSLGTLTVGNLSVTVPSAYKLPGSRGTPAPGSVVNVLNDYIFYNSQAFYNLGNRPQLLQILSTDEASASIRPTVRTITPTAEGGIAALYYDAKVYISVPFNSDTNNATIIFDTELEAWLPNAYDIGFKQFLRYTDTNGNHHLLAVKPGDNQLTELGTIYGDNIEGDYGQSIITSLLTGLYNTLPDRYDFQFVEEMEFEVNNPQGMINFELLGIEHSKGFISVKQSVLEASTGTITTAGWDTFAWDSTPWDDTSVVPTPFSEVSAKRYSVVQSELNAVQWHIFTNTLSARYILRSLQTWGTDSNDAHPSQWRI